MICWLAAFALTAKLQNCSFIVYSLLPWDKIMVGCVRTLVLENAEFVEALVIN